MNKHERKNSNTTTIYNPRDKESPLVIIHVNVGSSINVPQDECLEVFMIRQEARGGGTAAVHLKRPFLALLYQYTKEKTCNNTVTDTILNSFSLNTFP